MEVFDMKKDIITFKATKNAPLSTDKGAFFE